MQQVILWVFGELICSSYLQNNPKEKMPFGLFPKTIRITEKNKPNKETGSLRKFILTWCFEKNGKGRELFCCPSQGLDFFWPTGIFPHLPSCCPIYSTLAVAILFLSFSKQTCVHSSLSCLFKLNSV